MRGPGAAIKPVLGPPPGFVGGAYNPNNPGKGGCYPPGYRARSGWCPPGMDDLADQIDENGELGREQQKRFYEPRYSYFNFLGKALQQNPATHLLNPGEYAVFQVGYGGQVGQGWDRALNPSETNMQDGANLPSGMAMAAASLSIDYMSDCPLHLMRHFDRFTCLKQKKGTHEWLLGRCSFWGDKSIGLHSSAVGLTQANRFEHFTHNGGTGAREFPFGAELTFESLSQIRFIFIVEREVYVTADGLPFNGSYVSDEDGGNGLDEAFGANIGVVMNCAVYESTQI